MQARWGIFFAVVGIVFVSLGGITGVKTIQSFMGIPMTFLCAIVMVGFVVWIIKRPRRVDGSFEDEPEVANAPDNGEPMTPKSKIKFLNKLGW